MQYDNIAVVAAANVARIPFWFSRRQPFQEPEKVLILKPCCLSQVILATPLLAALSDKYQDARFDWAVSEWARPAISGNPRITKLLDSGLASLPGKHKENVGDLVARIQAGDYDTCIVPSRSLLLSYISWRAGIPQRIGLNSGGRGFAYTRPVPVSGKTVNEGALYLELAGIDDTNLAVRSEFYPSDRARNDITRLMVEELAWQGDQPLVIIHPGGGDNPVAADTSIRWPPERYASLANRLVGRLSARIALVGSQDEAPLIRSIKGLMSVEVTDLAGRLDLDHIGAMTEVADLYIGNDAGPTHVAAAVGCKTLAIYGPTDPDVSAPYLTKGAVRIIRPDSYSVPFNWDQGPTVSMAVEAAIDMLSSTSEF